MMTTRSTLLGALLCLTSLSPVAAGFHNSGSMHSKSSSLFCPEVINTGSMVAEDLDASGLVKFVNSGTIAFENARINHNALFIFQHVQRIELTSTSSSIWLHTSQDQDCHARFMSPNNRASAARLNYNPVNQTLQITLQASGDHLDIFVPSHCLVHITAPKSILSFDENVKLNNIAITETLAQSGTATPAAPVRTAPPAQTQSAPQYSAPAPQFSAHTQYAPEQQAKKPRRKKLSKVQKAAHKKYKSVHDKAKAIQKVSKKGVKKKGLSTGQRIGIRVGVALMACGIIGFTAHSLYSK